MNMHCRTTGARRFGRARISYLNRSSSASIHQDHAALPQNPSRARLAGQWLAGLFAGLTLAGSALAQNAEFIPLGDLPGGDFFSSAYDVSDNGGVVVGLGRSERGQEAMIWTPATGMQPMTPPDAADLLARGVGVSRGGLVVAGYGVRDGEDIAQPFRWTAADGPQWLGDLPGGQQDSEAQAISADGSTVVGFGHSGFGREAFHWTAETGLTGLGELEGGIFFSLANDVSGDGGVVVGTSVVQGDSCYEAFRWTQQDGMVGIGYLPGGEACPALPVPIGGFGSRALAVSGDGTVIVGRSKSSNAGPEWMEAFRWTEIGGMVGLGDLPGGRFSSFAADVSSNGNVIVGGGYTDAGGEAFVWTPEDGMRRLQDVLEDGGATGLEGWRLTGARAVSADGLWVAGTGVNLDGDYEAFLARLPGVSAGGFDIIPALNDAWFNEDTPGQGFFISVLPESAGGLIFLAWFTYDTERPPDSTQFNLEGAGHRWRTAFGPYQGNRAVLDIEVTTGGIFDSRLPAPGQVLDGTIELVFSGCNSATLSYDIPSIDRSGSMIITRIVPDNVAACEAAATR